MLAKLESNAQKNYFGSRSASFGSGDYSTAYLLDAWKELPSSHYDYWSICRFSRSTAYNRSVIRERLLAAPEVSDTKRKRKCIGIVTT